MGCFSFLTNLEKKVYKHTIITLRPLPTHDQSGIRREGARILLMRCRIVARGVERLEKVHQCRGAGLLGRDGRVRGDLVSMG